MSRVFFKLLFFFFLSGGTGSPTAPIRGEEDGTPGQPITGVTSLGDSGKLGCEP